MALINKSDFTYLEAEDVYTYGGTAESPMNVSGTNWFAFTDGDHYRVSNIVMSGGKNTSASALSVSGTGTTVEFINCTFSELDVKATYGIFEVYSGANLIFTDCTFSNFVGSNNSAIFGCEDGASFLIQGTTNFIGIATTNKASIFGPAGKNAAGAGGDIVLGGTINFESEIGGQNIVLGDNAYAIFGIEASYKAGTKIAIKSDSVTLEGAESTTLENVTFLLPESYEQEYELKFIGFHIDADHPLNIDRNDSRYRLQNEAEANNNLADFVTNCVDTDKGVVFCTATSGGSYSEALGTFVAPSTLHLNGEENNVTLSGTYDANGYRTFIHKLNFNGNIYSNGGDLYLNNVTMNSSSRIYGGAYTNVRGNIQGAIYAAGKNTDEAGAIRLEINNTSEHTASYGNVFGGLSITDSSLTGVAVESIDTVINGGNFKNFTGNGTLISTSFTSDSYTTTQGASSLTIKDGTFASTIYAGAFSDGNQANVTDTINLVIDGGTFNGNVTGGCLASNTLNANYTTVSADINVTISGGTFNKWLVAGSRGKGLVDGNTCLTFKDGGTLAFNGSEAFIIGCSAMYTPNDKETWSVTGTTTLAFDGFTGTLGGIIKESFTNVNIKNNSSATVGSDNCAMLSMVDTWDLEIGADNINGAALLTFGGHNDNVCDLTDDTLNLTFADGATLAVGGSVTLIDFGSINEVNFEDLGDITLAGAELPNNYEVTFENNRLMLGRLA